MDKIDQNDLTSSEQIVKNPYYQRLQEELKQKKRLEQFPDALLNEDSIQQHIGQTKNEKIEEVFEDKVDLDQDTKEDLIFEKVDSIEMKWKNKPEEYTYESEHQKKTMKEFLSNGKQILRNLSHQINFKNRTPELKELYKHTLIESRSHNTLMALFSQFKAGVVGQILSWIGVPIQELKFLKEQAFKQAFDDNCAQMANLIYNTELVELVKGKRVGKKTAKLYEIQMNQLIKGMDLLGYKEYWSKTKILEEKIKQCQRIEDEFRDELSRLEYMSDYCIQGNVTSS